MRIARLAAITAALAYGTAIALVFLLERSILYPVPQNVRTAPAAADFPQAQEVVLDTADGEKVIVWHVPPRGDKPVLMFFHGNGDVLAWRVSRFRDIVADGVGLIALSFRGYSGSSGQPSEAGLIEDGAVAYSFAAARYPARRIVPWGYSLGSGVAVAIAAGHPVGGLVLEAPYSSIADVMAESLPFLPMRWLLRDQYRSDLRITAVRVPLLIMHGVNDTVIPIRFGERLFALANDPKRMVRFPQGDHVNLDAQGAMKVVKEFLAQIELPRQNDRD